MGLDQYLHKKTYIGNKYREAHKRVRVVVPKNQDGVIFPVARINNKRISQVVEEVAYWRKANAIHSWFVQNVQDGNDDCGEYYVTQEQLQELLDTINKVLKASKLTSGTIRNGMQFTGGTAEPILEEGKYIKDPTMAHKLLPTARGFFFGSADYDQYYVEDLKYTKKALTRILKEDGDYYYSSSW